MPGPLHFVNGEVKRMDIGVSRIPRSMITLLQAKITDPESVTPATHMPAFHLSQADLDDVTVALLSMAGEPLTGKEQARLIIQRQPGEFHPDGEMGRLYQRFKCNQCHRFNGQGGTLAPDLSYEGSRSNRDWLVNFLQDPQTLRPTLTVRMPRFNMSEQDATTIADYISSTLRRPGADLETLNASQFTRRNGGTR